MTDFKSVYYRLAERQPVAERNGKGSHIKTISDGWLRRMAYVTRYSTQPMLHKQNVPEHCFFTAMLAYFIAMDMSKRGIKVSPELAVTKAILHDLEEALTGDIVVLVKYYTQEMHDEVTKVGQEMLWDALIRDLGFDIGAEVWEAWNNAKDKTLEGRIVAFCDLLEVTGYVKEEILMGNKRAEQIETNVKNLLSPYLDMEEFAPYVREMLGLDFQDMVDQQEATEDAEQQV